jgi:hypothetical protein
MYLRSAMMSAITAINRITATTVMYASKPCSHGSALPDWAATVRT